MNSICRQFTFALLILIQLAWIGSASAQEEARKWSSKNGDFSVAATFVRLEDGKAVLKKENGKTIKVPVAKLSSADRRYLVELNRTKNAKASGKPAKVIDVAEHPRHRKKGNLPVVQVYRSKGNNVYELYPGVVFKGRDGLARVVVSGISDPRTDPFQDFPEMGTGMGGPGGLGGGQSIPASRSSNMGLPGGMGGMGLPSGMGGGGQHARPSRPGGMGLPGGKGMGPLGGDSLPTARQNAPAPKQAVAAFGEWSVGWIDEGPDKRTNVRETIFLKSQGKAVLLVPEVAIPKGIDTKRSKPVGEGFEYELHIFGINKAGNLPELTVSKQTAKVTELKKDPDSEFVQATIEYDLGNADGHQTALVTDRRGRVMGCVDRRVGRKTCVECASFFNEAAPIVDRVTGVIEPGNLGGKLKFAIVVDDRLQNIKGIPAAKFSNVKLKGRESLAEGANASVSEEPVSLQELDSVQAKNQFAIFGIESGMRVFAGEVAVESNGSVSRCEFDVAINQTVSRKKTLVSNTTKFSVTDRVQLKAGIFDLVPGCMDQWHKGFKSEKQVTGGWSRAGSPPDTPMPEESDFDKVIQWDSGTEKVLGIWESQFVDLWLKNDGISTEIALPWHPQLVVDRSGKSAFLVSRQGHIHRLNMETMELEESTRYDVRIAGHSQRAPIGVCKSGLVLGTHNGLLIVDPSSLAPTGWIPIDNLHNIACHPDLDQVYVIDGRLSEFGLKVVDTADQKVAHSIPFSKNSIRFSPGFGFMQISPDGKYLYTGSSFLSRFRIEDSDLVFEERTQNFIGAKNQSSFLWVSPDGNRIGLAGAAASGQTHPELAFDPLSYPIMHVFDTNDLSRPLYEFEVPGSKMRGSFRRFVPDSSEDEYMAPSLSVFNRYGETILPGIPSKGPISSSYSSMNYIEDGDFWLATTRSDRYSRVAKLKRNRQAKAEIAAVSPKPKRGGGKRLGAGTGRAGQPGMGMSPTNQPPTRLVRTFSEGESIGSLSWIEGKYRIQEIALPQSKPKASADAGMSPMAPVGGLPYAGPKEKLSEWSAKGKFLFMANRDGKLFKVDAGSTKIVTVGQIPGTIEYVDQCKSGLLVTTNRSQVHLVDPETLEVLKSIPVTIARRTIGHLSHDWAIAVTGTNQIWLLDIAGGKVVDKLAGKTERRGPGTHQASQQTSLKARFINRLGSLSYTSDFSSDATTIAAKCGSSTYGLTIKGKKLNIVSETLSSNPMGSFDSGNRNARFLENSSLAYKELKRPERDTGSSGFGFGQKHSIIKGSEPGEGQTIALGFPQPPGAKNRAPKEKLPERKPVYEFGDMNKPAFELDRFESTIVWAVDEKANAVYASNYGFPLVIFDLNGKLIYEIRTNRTLAKGTPKIFAGNGGKIFLSKGGFAWILTPVQ